MPTHESGTGSAEPNPPPDVECDLDTTPVREVRRRVRGLLTGLGGIRVEDAVLVADELIANAHQHGSAPRTCRLTYRGRRLRIEVDDASPRQPRMRTPDRTGGRGMILIDRLASSWGVQNHPDHKTVWAELALDGPGSSGNAPHLAVPPPVPSSTDPSRRNDVRISPPMSGGPCPGSDSVHGVSQRCDTDPPLPPGLDLRHRVVDGTFVIAAIGDVDTDTAPALSAAINSCIDQADDRPCVLDLSDVTFLDSAGLTALLHATLHSEAQRQPLPIVVDANRPVIRPIEVTGLDDTLTLYHTIDEAVKASKPQETNADGSPKPA